jgi:hypothetical protein
MRFPTPELNYSYQVLVAHLRNLPLPVLCWDNAVPDESTHICPGRSTIANLIAS